jgi:hypothetical protein
MKMEVKNIGEVLNEGKTFSGDRVEFLSLLNRSFIIKDFDVRQSKFYNDRQYAIIQGCNLEGSEDFIAFTTSTVVIDKLKKIKEKNAFPVAAKLIKKKRYFDLVSPDL